MLFFSVGVKIMINSRLPLSFYTGKCVKSRVVVHNDINISRDKAIKSLLARTPIKKNVKCAVC